MQFFLLTSFMLGQGQEKKSNNLNFYPKINYSTGFGGEDSQLHYPL